MATFQFDLVSPERLLFSGQVEQVDVPGSEGDFGVLFGHAPLVALLRPGILTIFEEREQTQVVVGGGFAEVNPDGLTVLAERAARFEDFDRAQLATELRDAEEDVADAKEDWIRDQARRRLEQLKVLEAALASTARPTPAAIDRR